MRCRERESWEERWAEWLARGDPFYSPHLTRTREDASLDFAEPGSLVPR